MRRRKALGVVFAYEGLQPTSEASDKKLTSGTGREKKTLDRERTRRPETGCPGNPNGP